MGFGQRSLLAREYELPKRPIFHLDGWSIIQGTDVAAYVSSSVTDGVMYGTNGCIGTRHHCESETAVVRTSVYMNGVYHSAPVNTYIDSEAFLEEVQLGATVCEVILDCIIDGESGTLRSSPVRRLDMRDATYSSSCSGVISGDGGLMFEAYYRRVVSLNDLNLWSAEVVYSNFSLNPLATELTVDSSNTFGYSAGYSGKDDCNSELQAYSVEFMATLVVCLDEWDLVRGDSMDEVLLRSLSSSVTVSTVTQTSCLVETSDSEYKIIPEHEIQRKAGDMYASSHEYPTSLVDPTNENESDCSAMPGLPWCGEIPAVRRVCLRKRFVYTVTSDSIPQKVTLSFHARHRNGGAVSRIFPSLSDTVTKQRALLEEFWSTLYIDMQQQDEMSPNRLRLALLFNSFRLFCVSRNLQCGLPRAGCSATRESLQYDLQQYIYHGIYYTLTSPGSALALLRSLYAMLPHARKNAHRLSLEHGAVFPRNTIAGDECRRHCNLSNTGLHLNAEIGRLINMFFSAVGTIESNDRLMLLELMLETARVWPQVGEWIENDGAFRLENIAGPDEYNADASGNFYIYLSAKLHLRSALNLYEQQRPVIGEDGVSALLKKIGMRHEELEAFETISNRIVVRRDDHLGVYMVHDHFDTLREWRDERPKHPFSMNYHPLAIYRHKVVDIPEVLLAMLLYPEEFEEKDFLRNLAYYAPICAFDSPESLGIVAAVDFRAHRQFARGMPFLRSLISLDLDNVIYTAGEGLNFGAMSSAWMAIVIGIGGVKITSRNLHLDPCFPVGLNVVTFTLRWRGATLCTTINKDSITYSLVSGESIRFVHADKYRIHLHDGHRNCAARQRVTIPQSVSCGHREFDGAVFLCESLFDNSVKMNFFSWYRILESLYENHRALHMRDIPALTAEEFIRKVIYQAEHCGIAFSGVHNVLLDRGIDLDLGSPDDAEIVETRYGLANAKVAEMEDTVSSTTPRVTPAFQALLRDLAESDISLAIVSYSRSLKTLMRYNQDSAAYFHACIDGEEAYERNIKSRPHLDIFVRAVEKIHVDPARCIVFSSHLDKNFIASELAQFRMVFDVEDLFVTEVMGKTAGDYPVHKAEQGDGGRPLVLRLARERIPTTIDALEDILCDPVTFAGASSRADEGVFAKEI
ncbi:Glycosyl hydrolase family 65 central catalytic domain [Trypanosoma vivax]|nr:Glycosyl hydrolase family 65 central catalytic domain [Trypanosoma vivax]